MSAHPGLAHGAGREPGMDPGAPDGLVQALERRWRDAGWSRPGDRVAVACSGGTDSLSLLHLLRFPLRGLGIRLEVAHFDHGMRAESEGEAQWLAGVAGAWGLPFHLGRAETPAGNEEEARGQRYRYLAELVRGEGIDRILTAHHADDQIETVLFRILRGTGVRGLRGIPERRSPRILRPLLPHSRADLEAYARRHGLNPRSDPTNRSARFARGRVRAQLLPLLEAVHPGARGGLLRLARNAERTTRALDALLEPLLERVVLGGEGGADQESRRVVDRERFLACGPDVQRELLRRLASTWGRAPSEAGTASALEFIRTGSSGGEVRLGSGVRLSREFGRIVFEWRPEVDVRRGWEEAGAGDSGGPGARRPGECLLTLPSDEPGEGEFQLGGVGYRARWGGGTPDRGASAGFDAEGLAFPLCFRSWRAGDRTRTTGGTKKLKKWFGERGIPRWERHRIPLLVDARSEVVWIPGYHVAAGSGSQPGGQRGASGRGDGGAGSPPAEAPGSEVSVPSAPRGGSWTVGLRRLDEG
jgi:tRNA(Ile)-lysidine synthase